VNVLTKAFVVLLAVMAVLVMALVVSFAANTENHRQLAEDMKIRLATAQAKEQSYQAAIAAAENARSSTFEALTQEVGALTAQREQLRNEIADLRTQLANAGADLARAKADFTSISSALDQNARLMELAQEEARTLRSDTLANARQIIQLEDRVNQLQAERDSLERTSQRYAQQIVALSETNRDLEETLRGSGVVTRTVERAAVPTQPIVGRIVRVKKNGSATMAELNLGSRDGVRERMEFLVHRGDTFLGRLVIEEVDVNASVGPIVMTAPGAEIRGGEGVYAGP